MNLTARWGVTLINVAINLISHFEKVIENRFAVDNVAQILKWNYYVYIGQARWLKKELRIYIFAETGKLTANFKKKTFLWCLQSNSF